MPTLEWIGKDKVVNHHQEVPFRILDKKYTFNAENSDNMIIHGDNLLALKSLLPQYEGLIDCIYIDPPYNTGNEKWVYNDNVNDPKIKKWLGQVVGAEGEDLSRHDKWLCMIYPRLKLLQKLLSERGVIFISIGEDEVATLKIICDEIFGYTNRCGIVSRVMKSGGNKGNFFSPNIDYILIYCKNSSYVVNFKAPMDEKIIKKLYTGIETEGVRKGQKYRPFGLYQSSLDPLRGCSNQRYYIEAPDGTLLIPPGNAMPIEHYDGASVVPITSEDKVWRWSRKRYLEEKQNGNILFKKSKGVLIDSEGNPAKWNVYTKIWLDDRQEEGQTPTNLIAEYENRHSAKELLPYEIKFDFAKPSKLIEYLIQISTINKNAIILDSFGGSGTTAHAVLNLNKKDNGNRKFILVEMMDYAETLTAERVKRVINGYGKGDKAVAGIPGDFTYYELGQPLFKDDKNLNEEVSEEEIRKYVYYMETKKPLDTQTTDNPYLLGKNNDTAYYFYYKKDEITTLNHEFLSTINTKATEYIIYADKCVLAQEVMEKFNIVFKKIPRDITRL